MSDAEDKTASLLAALWLRNLPLVEERLGLLDRTTAAAVAGTLNEGLREEAANTAHKLAGSLGMYGYDQGTRLAQQIELQLDCPTPDPERLSDLTAKLRQAVLPEA